MPLSYLLEAGVTTVIGCLGTDGLTRSVESVLMKTKALRAEGVSAFMLTGDLQGGQINTVDIFGFSPTNGDSVTGNVSAWNGSILDFRSAGNVTGVVSALEDIVYFQLIFAAGPHKHERY